MLPRVLRVGARIGVLAVALEGAACARNPRGTTPEARVDLVIAATTDVHGRIRAWDYFDDRSDSTRGLTRVATIVDSVRASNPGRVILLDAGDLLQGNPFTFLAAREPLSGPHPVVAAMNAMAYDATTIGNHEFNYGIPALDRAIHDAKFPFLATNAYLPSGARAYPAFRIVERAGVRVAIIGATTPGSLVWDRDNLAGRLVLKDIVPEVRIAVDEARRRGADVVVVTVHSGFDGPSSYDTASTGVPSENVAGRIAREVPGIDLIVFGHSHQEVAGRMIGSTLLMQPKFWAASLAVARLTIARASTGSRVVDRHGVVIPAAGHAESPVVVAAVTAAHAATVSYVNRVIGNTATAWRADSARVRDTPLIDFVLEVERRTAGTDLASTPAFSLNASIAAGPITVGEIARLYPYDNTLRAIRISGRQLREYLEYSARYFRSIDATSESIIDSTVPGFNYDIVSGAFYVIDLDRPLGQRISSLVARGKPVVDTDTFTLALNNYRQTGGGGYAMLHDAPLVYDGQRDIRQLLIDEVVRQRTLRTEDYFTPNWSLEPPGAISRALARMRQLDAPHTLAAPRAGIPAPTPPALMPAGRTLRIIATNDFHGTLEPRPDSSGTRRGGIAYVATAIEQARAECAARAPDCESLLVDGGDLFQGTLASNVVFGAPVIAMYNRMGYAATALGNHEFDWGRDTLRARMRGARFSIMGANVRYADGRDVEWIPDDTLVTVHGLRVGLIGIADPETPRTTVASSVAGLQFVDPAPVIDARARALRARGATVVVVLAHMGAFCKREPDPPACDGSIIQLAQRITGKVDAIVSGHTHSIVNTVVNGIPIIQAGSSGRAIGVIDLPLGDGAGRATAEIRNVVADRLAPFPAIDSLVQQAVAAVAERTNQPIVVVGDAMRRTGNQHALGNLIADAQRAAGSADIAIMNNGGIRADLRAGQATYASLYEIQPFGNALVKATVRGKDLRAYFERLVANGEPRVHVSGLRIGYAPTKPPGSRVFELVLDGNHPLRDDAMYSIVMSDFLLTGGDGLALGTAATQTTRLNVNDLDALIAYVRARPSPLRGPAESRIVPAYP